jgi:hypothetical protein
VEITETLLEGLHSRANPAEEGYATFQCFRFQWLCDAAEDIDVDALNFRRFSMSFKSWSHEE